MSVVRESTRYWPVPVVRAIPAAAVGLTITFSANHTASFGLVMFGIFAAASGAVLIWAAIDRFEGVLNGTVLAQAIVALLAALAALALSFSGVSSAALGFLLFLITGFFATTGFLELYAGFRSRGRNASSRDWVIIGGFTAISALVFLVVPMGSVAAVGLFGAYCILIAVFLVIAGLSLKWSGQDSSDSSASDDPAAATTDSTTVHAWSAGSPDR